MCRPPAPEGCCGGARRCIVRRATVQSALLRAIKPCCQQLLAYALGEVTNAALGNAILEVGVHATEGKLLARVLACLFKGIVGESPIVTVVVLDSDTVFGSKGHKGAFGGNGFDQ